MSAGTELRDQGVSDVLAADAAINRDFRSLIEEGVAAFVTAGITYTADDIRDWIERHHPGREPHDPNVWGAGIRAASAGLAVGDGYTVSTRPERHGAIIRKWRPTARRAAA